MSTRDSSTSEPSEKISVLVAREEKREGIVSLLVWWLQDLIQVS